MIRGTRIMSGDEARKYSWLCDTLRQKFRDLGFEEVIVPSLSEQELFVDRAGPEILNQMYTFNDRGDRQICLIPEVTAIIQKIWREEWSKNKPKPYKVFYIQRCYRYERPQKGRYREFTQAGVEILGGNPEECKEIAMSSLKECIEYFTDKATINDSVKRGLDYYIEDGFEVEIASLGAQKQVAGGGSYDGGAGWAIGVDRLLLALQE